MRRGLIALPLAALVAVTVIAASSNRGGQSVRAAPLLFESQPSAPSSLPEPAHASDTHATFDKLGLMTPGGQYRLVMRQYKRDDGTQPGPRADSMVGPSRARRTIEIRVDAACNPESTVVVAGETDGLPWYTIRTVNGRETVEFHQRPGVDLSNVKLVQELAGPPASPANLPPGRMCSLPLPLGRTWSERIVALGGTFAGSRAHPGVQVDVYVLRLQVVAPDKAKVWSKVPGFRDISASLVEVVQEVLIDPKTDFVVANYSYAVLDNGNRILVESFEIEESNCTPDCRY